jgi:hypothetical protein
MSCQHAVPSRNADEDIIPAGTVPTKQASLHSSSIHATDTQSNTIAQSRVSLKSIPDLVQQSGQAQEALRRLQSEPNLPPDQKKMLDDYLLQEFTDTYDFLISSVYHRDDNALKDERFHRNLISLAQYISASLASFTSEQQNKILTQLFWARRAVIERGVSNFSWSGFDHFSFGLIQLDKWASAGHPIRDYDIEPAQVFVVCPRYPITQNGRASIWHGLFCSDEWYVLATETRENRKRLTTYLKEKDDPMLTATVFLNLIDFPQKLLLEITDDLEDAPIAWEAAWKVLTRFVFTESGETVSMEKLVGLWREHPALRVGILLYLARVDYLQNGDFDIGKDFESRFGERISKDTFEALLDQAPLDLALVSRVWPALSTGWSRVDLLIPRSDQLLNGEFNNGSAQNPTDDIYSIIDQICLFKERSEVLKLQAYLRSRRKMHPDYEVDSLIEYIAKAQCAPHRRAPQNSEQSGSSLRIIQTEDD